MIAKSQCPVSMMLRRTRRCISVWLLREKQRGTKTMTKSWSAGIRYRMTNDGDFFRKVSRRSIDDVEEGETRAQKGKYEYDDGELG